MPRSKSKRSRYTPPPPKKLPPRPTWVPVPMFILLGVGMVTVIVNYLEVLPGGAKNSYLFLGLGLITAGFMLATRWR